MSVVATSVFLLFALIVPGIYIRKTKYHPQRKHPRFFHPGLKSNHAGNCILLHHRSGQIAAIRLRNPDLCHDHPVTRMRFLDWIVTGKSHESSRSGSGRMDLLHAIFKQRFHGNSSCIIHLRWKRNVSDGAWKCGQQFSDLFRGNQTAHMEISDQRKIKYPKNGTQQY